MGNGFVQQRSIGKCILFSFITCGIYSLFWIYSALNDLYYLDGSNESPAKDLILGIVTCGIYYFWMWAKMARMISNIRVKNNLPDSNNSVLFVVLYLFGLGLVNLCIVQDNINAFANFTPASGNGDSYTIEDREI